MTCAVLPTLLGSSAVAYCIQEWNCICMSSSFHRANKEGDDDDLSWTKEASRTKKCWSWIRTSKCKLHICCRRCHGRRFWFFVIQIFQKWRGSFLLCGGCPWARGRVHGGSSTINVKFYRQAEHNFLRNQVWIRINILNLIVMRLFLMKKLLSSKRRN